MSNVVTADEAVITVREGDLLLFHYSDIHGHGGKRMNPIILDERLSAAAELAREALAGRRSPVAADVGCDHGF